MNGFNGYQEGYDVMNYARQLGVSQDEMDFLIDWEDYDDGKPFHDFERYETENLADFDAIHILLQQNGKVNVSVKNDDSEEVQIHLHGKAKHPNLVNFETYIEKRILMVNSGSRELFSDDEMTLDVKIPKKMLNSLHLDTLGADVSLGNGVSAKEIYINGASGSIEAKNIVYEKGEFFSVSGDIDLVVNAKSNIATEISTTKGDVTVQFLNVGKMEVETFSEYGSSSNCHVDGKGYKADVYVHSRDGDIKIR